MARVRRWRERHPGYWRKPLLPKDALQDSLPVETVDNRALAQHLAQDTLQDVLSAQSLVLLGLIAQLTGSALQDDIATTARRLRQLGHDLLNSHFLRKGASYAHQTPLNGG